MTLQDAQYSQLPYIKDILIPVPLPFIEAESVGAVLLSIIESTLWLFRVIAASEAKLVMISVLYYCTHDGELINTQIGGYQWR